jgi:hypothetical protein
MSLKPGDVCLVLLDPRYADDASYKKIVGTECVIKGNLFAPQRKPSVNCIIQCNGTVLSYHTEFLLKKPANVKPEMSSWDQVPYADLIRAPRKPAKPGNE